MKHEAASSHTLLYKIMLDLMSCDFHSILKSSVSYYDGSRMNSSLEKGIAWFERDDSMALCHTVTDRIELLQYRHLHGIIHRDGESSDVVDESSCC
jgi:hypothetical protein